MPPRADFEGSVPEYDPEITPKALRRSARLTTRAARSDPIPYPSYETTSKTKPGNKKSNIPVDQVPSDVFGPIPLAPPDGTDFDPKDKIKPASPWSLGPIKGLWAILMAKIPAIPLQLPSITSSRISTNTRTITNAELKLPESSRLRKIVPFALMMDQLVAATSKLLNGAKPFSSNDKWLHTVDPEITSSHLPRFLFTEHDTEDYIWSVLVRPVLAVLYYCLYRKTPEDGPFFSSVGGGRSIPDAGLFMNINDLRAIFEVKNPSVFENLVGVLENLFHDCPSMPIGRAVKFNWPKRVGKLSKVTKVICQVWCQMCTSNVNYGVLTSYTHTYFMVRSKEDPNTLYISRGYTPEDDLLLVLFAFLALAAGHLPDLQLPKADITHWKGDESEEPGIVESMLLPDKVTSNEFVSDRETGFERVDSLIG